MIKCSFDFDGTLDNIYIQDYALELINRGIEVWIDTSRFDKINFIKQYHSSLEYAELANKDLFDIAKRLGISNHHIYFTKVMDSI